MTPTEKLLLEAHKTPMVPLTEICEAYFSMCPKRAMYLASKDQLPVPTFRLSRSQKSPRFVSIPVLAGYIDEMQQRATAAWAKSQV